ncbi:MAG: SAM-dependent methyltransferase, partial [Lachnospiraceae bacterium]|nr:SAM-dependent methyltransferase [Lachnospiraceae bacterium]
MALSERLRTIISMIPENKCTADIGTDHGFVPISVVSEGIAESAIASDVRKGPLMRAQTHIQEAGLSDRIDCRLGDG